MASSGKQVAAVVHKLQAITQIRSGIRKPWWQKRTLKALGLGKMNKTVIMKNTETMNKQLLSVRDLIRVQPVVIQEGNNCEIPSKLAATDTRSSLFLNSKFEFDVEKFKRYVETAPDAENK